MTQAMVGVLRAYHAPKNFGSDHTALEDFPPEIAARIAAQLENLLTGKIPPAFKALERRGRRNSSDQTDDIRCAVLYIRAARLAVVDDKYPKITIENWFKLQKRSDNQGGTSIDRWLKDQKYKEEIPENFYPEWRREDRAALIATLARSAGDHWTASQPSKRTKKS